MPIKVVLKLLKCMKIKLSMSNKNFPWVIGDVHGCYHTLLQLIQELPKNADIIFVGDLCDKGLYTKEVIEFIIKNNYRCVLGNHDELMRINLKKALKGIDSTWSTLPAYAGYATVDSYRSASTRLVNKHIKWIASLPCYIEFDKFFITHGFGLPYYQRKDERKKEISLRTNRLDPKHYSYDWEENWEDYDVINIFGHDSHDDVKIGKNYYDIDTACKYGNKLTAIDLGSMELVSVPVNLEDLDIEKDKEC